MNKIQVLDQITIDKIAAGEVIERPASVVKELVENAIDAGSTSVTVEIKEGGIAFLRVADNGSGIVAEDVRNAFLRHSTSKIRSVEDLTHISSLGFRGEALSSIAAVAQVELITKTKDSEFGTRYLIAGGKEETLEETGAPDGTSFIVRQLFYNTPARRKFLKTPMTEASHVGDLLTRLALSHPEVSFRFINNGQSKLHTSGNGSLKDVIYHVYGREVAANLIEVNYDKKGIKISGYLGKPLISRGNRNFENYFVGGRYIKSNILSKAIEDGYKDFTMQHKYPFVVLYINVDGESVDVNVHPTKMDVRFSNQQEIYNAMYEAVDIGLHERELIPEVTLDEPKMKIPQADVRKTESARSMSPGTSKSQPESTIFEHKKGQLEAIHPEHIKEQSESAQPEHKKGQPESILVGTFGEQMGAAPSGSIKGHTEAAQPGDSEEQKLDYYMQEMKRRVQAYHDNRLKNIDTKPSESSAPEINRVAEQTDHIYSVNNKHEQSEEHGKSDKQGQLEKSEHLDKQEQFQKPEKIENQAQTKKPQQLNFFEEKLLQREARAEHKIVGQVFDTYWLVEYHDNLYIIDQHAAHERVLYERTLKGMQTREFTSQMISPPIILNLTMQEAELLNTYMDQFTRIGFEFEDFGQDSFAVRAVPDNLFSIAKKELLMEMIDSLSDEINRNASSNLIDEKIASMSCKAAVKGNMSMSAAEVDALIGELLTLENPYHCPHGRPTIISMSKRELEKKFKRIV